MELNKDQMTNQLDADVANGFTSWSWTQSGDDSGMLRIDVDDVQLVDNGVSTSDVINRSFWLFCWYKARF